MIEDDRHSPVAHLDPRARCDTGAQKASELFGVSVCNADDPVDSRLGFGELDGARLRCPFPVESRDGVPVGVDLWVTEEKVDTVEELVGDGVF